MWTKFDCDRNRFRFEFPVDSAKLSPVVAVCTSEWTQRCKKIHAYDQTQVAGKKDYPITHYPILIYNSLLIPFPSFRSFMFLAIDLINEWYVINQQRRITAAMKDGERKKQGDKEFVSG